MEKLRVRLKKTGLEALFEEVIPEFALVEMLDTVYNSGQAHPSVNINDKVRLFTERRSEQDEAWEGRTDKKGPPKGESFGLAHHGQKLLIFLVALRVRGVLKEVDLINVFFIMLKVYREESREIGLHYVQEVMDHLNKTCLWSDKGDLGSHFKEPEDKVVRRLEKAFPKTQSRKGEDGVSMWEKAKPSKGKGRKGQWETPTKPGRPSPGRRGDRRRDSPPRRGDRRGEDRSRSRPRKGADKGKGDGKGSSLSQQSTEVKAAFSLAKKEGKVCHFYQIGTCHFDPCRATHACVICGKHHGANKCPDIKSNKAKKLLGL